jgi:hypothetical protein
VQESGQSSYSHGGCYMTNARAVTPVHRQALRCTLPHWTNSTIMAHAGHIVHKAGHARANARGQQPVLLHLSPPLEHVKLVLKPGCWPQLGQYCQSGGSWTCSKNNREALRL